jgi:hypothetical protein
VVGADAESSDGEGQVILSLEEDRDGRVRLVVEDPDTSDMQDSGDWSVEMDLEELQRLADRDDEEDWPFPARTDMRADDMVAFGHDITVAPGQVVPGSVVCILGSAHIHGRVQHEVVTIGGHIDLYEGSMVRGEAVAIGGGNINAFPGSVVRGQAVTVGGRVRQSDDSLIGERVEISFIPSFGRGFGVTGLGWVVFLVHLLFVGFVGWILLRLGLRRWGVSIATLKVRGWEALLAGVGGSILYHIVIVPLMLVLAVAMIAIVVGIPLVPVLGLLFLIFPVPGYLVTCTLLGLTVAGRSGDAEPEGVAEGPESSVAPRLPAGMGRTFILGHLLLSAPWFAGQLLASAGAPPVPAKIFFLLSVAVINLAIALGWGAFLLSRLGRRAPAV